MEDPDVIKRARLVVTAANELLYQAQALQDCISNDETDELKDMAFEIETMAIDIADRIGVGNRTASFIIVD